MSRATPLAKEHFRTLPGVGQESSRGRRPEVSPTESPDSGVSVIEQVLSDFGPEFAAAQAVAPWAQSDVATGDDEVASVAVRSGFFGRSASGASGSVAGRRAVPGASSDVGVVGQVASRPAGPMPPAGTSRGTALTALAGLLLGALATVVWLQMPLAGLLITVSLTSGAQPRSLAVIVDGEPVCRASPCTVDGLRGGRHVIQIAAVGVVPVTRAIDVEPGEQTAYAFVLAPRPGDSPVPDAPIRREPRAANEQRPAQPDLLSPPSSPPVQRTTTASPGTLRANSIPVSRVLVDGRPAGRTPLVSSLPAGAHRVVFIHPDLGRRALNVRVVPGEQTVAAVRFATESD